MNRTLSLKIMALLAFAQGAFGLLRAYGWVRVGADLFGQGLLILSAVGTVAVLRGMFIAGVAFLYFLFFCGALLGSRWAWPVCLAAVIINLLLVLSALFHGAPLMQAIAWAVIPAILLFWVFSPMGRKPLNSGQASI
ncbi:MAG: hypothetical protein ACM37Z_14065 [Deltaproteobacteria bacterium]